MGLASGWFEETSARLPNLPNLEWLEKVGNAPYFGVSRNRSKLPDGSPKPICVVIDAAGWLFRTYSFSNNRPASTVGDLADVHIEKLGMYLKNPAVTCVMFLFDRKTPYIKTVSRRQDESTPETPLHLVGSGFTGNEEQKAAAAWRIKLSQNRDSTDRDGLRLSGVGTASTRSFLLPPPKMTFSQQGSGTAGGKRTEFAYEECLKNRHFKKWLCKELSSLILESIDVPEGKRLIVSGPDMCVQKYGDQIGTPDEKFRYSYMEMDNSVGYWAAELAEEYDVDIDSEDGDTVITGLLGCHLRIRPGYSVMDTNRAFVNRLRLLRFQWAGQRSETTVIDINNLYTVLQYTHCALGKTHNIDVHNPIGNYALLAFAGGCDYVDGGMLQGVSKTVLLKTYFTYFPLFAQTLVSSHADNPSQVTINMDSFARLILCCYQNVRGKGKLNIPVDNLAEGCRILRENDNRTSGRPYPTPALMRVLAGNICWTLTYFASGSVKTARLPDGLALVDGLPVYGYISATTDANVYGFNIVDYAEDANVNPLNWKHKDRRTRNPDEWVDNTLVDLKKST